MLVRAAVVDNQMQAQLAGRLFVDTLEKADEFLMPVARHAVADHCAVEHAQSGKPRGGAVAFVVVSLPSRNVWAQRQHGLSAIQGLD